VSIRSGSAKPLVLRALSAEYRSSSSSLTSTNDSLLTSPQPHTRRVTGSIPVGTTQSLRSSAGCQSATGDPAHHSAVELSAVYPQSRSPSEPVERIRHTIEVGVVEVGIGVCGHHDRRVAHGHLR